MKNFNFQFLSKISLTSSCLFLCICQAMSQAPEVAIDTQKPFITGLTSAMQLVHAGDGSNRIFVAERGGIIKVFAPGALGTPITFLNLNQNGQVVLTGNEDGLLSIAFHPDFETNGYFYAYYSNLLGDLVVARYRATNPASNNTVNPNTGFEVIKIPHPINTNHNGGEMHFGSDGFLYLSIGDGGGSNDPNQNAKNPDVLLGKILRIDVNVPDTNPVKYAIPAGNPYNNPVYALGLRNPFRWSFDRLNGDIWIGDVGQGAREEINHRTPAQLNNANFGWRCFEGDIPTPDIDRTGCDAAGPYVDPAYAYANGTRGRSVVGGVVYRGTRSPLMYGWYIGTDYFSGDIHKISADESVKSYETSTVTGITDIGEDQSGEIYAVTGSTIYRIISDSQLPLTLVNFSGTRGNEGVKLSWSTSSEEDFRGFDVEQSFNAVQFEKVGTVSGENAVSGSQYTFSHPVDLTSDLYYRLKMIDQDDSFEYSKIVVVKSTDALSANFVRPSLISNGIIDMVINDSFTKMELISTSGKVFMSEKISKNGPFSIPIQGTETGIYIVRLTGRNKVMQQKVLVVR
ncbi:PQQ-dependent sugar dehydrogenase [Dyadobacter psychrophilus]|uniref:Por secretion system C-terminal sorting domain-containing protein n=1 Tax=Dyadobacter psychrophilus TaxID=651661 RepID=A0A1T5H319_9BACT|nr:PQQ-dependent sugar dehydrogenase [Dyadobacter psychrophilus]SKC14989.1 Por secretion system C-terminal sorting domain-containing protein [Dyadobacter psychrophilus]